MHPEQKRSLQSMKPEQKLKLLSNLFRSAHKLKAAGLRKQHPNWTEEEVQKNIETFFFMPDHDLTQIFISRLNNLGVQYIVTGAVASIIYGEPRLTYDLDVVIELHPEDVDRFTAAFFPEIFYCPPSQINKTNKTSFIPYN